MVQRVRTPALIALLVATVAAAVLAAPAAGAVPGARGALFVGLNGDDQPGTPADGVYRIDPTTLTQTRVLNGLPGWDVSNDGTRIAFITNSGTTIRELASGNERVIPDATGNLLFSPSGDELLIGEAVYPVAGGAPRPLVPQPSGGDTRIIFAPGAWGVDGIYGGAATQAADGRFSQLSSLTRMNPTTGATTLLRSPARAYPPVVDGPPPRVFTGSAPTGGTLGFADIAPDAGEALVFDLRRTEVYWICELLIEQCPAVPGCPEGVEEPGGSGGGVARLCNAGQGFGRQPTSGGTPTLPADWVGTSLANFFGRGTKIPLAYTPDGDTVVAELTGDSMFQQFTGADIKVEGEPESLLHVGINGSGPTGTASLLRVRWTTPALPATTVTQRPESRTRTTSETFRFALVPGFSGQHKCSVDGGSFQPCNNGTLPQGFVVSDLSEGAHSLQVFFDVQGSADDGPITTVDWTVDLTAPTVQLTSGPPVSTSETTATFSFSSASPDTEGFRCSVDGGPGFPCVSPHTERDLTPGSHTFSVVARDDVGNESVPADAQWEITGPPPPPPGGGTAPEPDQSFDCTAPDVPRIAFGVIVAVGLEGCLQATRDPDRFTSRGPILVNGIGIVPDGDTEIRISRNAANASIVTTGPSTLRVGTLSWKVDDGFTWDELSRGRLAVINRLFEMGDTVQADGVRKLEAERRGRGLKNVFGFNLVAAPKAEFSAENGGQVKLTLKLAIPNLLRSTPGKVPSGVAVSETGVTFEGAAITSNDRGFQWQGRVQIPEFWIGGRFKVKDASLAFDSAQRQFDGVATFEFSDQAIPAALKNRAKAITIALSVGPPGFPVKKLGLSVSELERHIGDGFYLQRAGLELFTGIGKKGGRVAGLTGSAGVSFLPKQQLGALFSGEVASLDGSLSFTFPADIEEFDQAVKSSGFELKGAYKLLNIPVGDVTVSSLNGVQTIEGNFDYTLAGIGFLGKIAPSSFASLVDLAFNFEATGEVILPGGLRARAEQIASTKGIMACYSLPGLSGVSVGYGLLRSAAGAESVSVTAACDVAAVRETATRARAAAAGETSTTVAAGTKALVVGVHTGAGTAPDAVLTGPGGVRLQTGEAGTSTRTSTGLVSRAAGKGETVFVVVRPAPGRWTVTTQDPATVAFGRDAPPARPRARLTRADRKGVRRLTIRATSIPGQRLAVFERGSAGVRGIGRLPGAGGTLRLRPAAALGTKRRLEVVVERAGLPRERVTVARFTVPGLGRPGVPRLAKDRRTIRWSGATGSAAYAISISGAQSLVRNQAGTTVRLPGKLAGKARVKVVIVAVDAAGKPGRARVATLTG